jgi:hypothetical protein
LGKAVATVVFGKELRIRQQNTGESDSAHFSVIGLLEAFSAIVLSLVLPCSASAKCPVKSASCPLSVQPGGKLMQKIHRLTDN